VLRTIKEHDNASLKKLLEVEILKGNKISLRNINIENWKTKINEYDKGVSYKNEKTKFTYMSGVHELLNLIN
jgi:hypothetical protein